MGKDRKRKQSSSSAEQSRSKSSGPGHRPGGKRKNQADRDTSQPKRRRTAGSSVDGEKRIASQKLPTSFDEAFDRKMDTLCMTIEARARLLQKLIDEKILTHVQVQNMLANQLSDYQLNQKLLDALMKRGPSDLRKFFRCLIETSQENIVRTIIGREPEDGEFESASDSSQAASDDADTDTSSDDDDEQSDEPVTVRRTRLTFYNEHSATAYQMDKEVRGVACIINVFETRGQIKREGTHEDCTRLASLFEQLNFTVQAYNDEDGLTAKDILAKIEETACREVVGEKPQCYVLFLLCHGQIVSPSKEEYILGTDGKPLFKREILDALSDERTSGNLHDVPRLVFFVCCRSRGNPVMIPDEEQDKVHVEYDHFLVGLPCKEGKTSYRSRKHGTRYVRCLVKLLSEQAHNTEVRALLEHQLNDELSKLRRRSVSGNRQSARVQSRLQRDFFFFPGIIQ